MLASSLTTVGQQKAVDGRGRNLWAKAAIHAFNLRARSERPETGQRFC